MKTADLIGPALDWAIASIEYPKDSGILDPMLHVVGDYDFTTNWCVGGPIIEREGIDTWKLSPSGSWGACIYSGHDNQHRRNGPTPLIAAMRCYVASKLGDEIEVPKELM